MSPPQTFYLAAHVDLVGGDFREPGSAARQCGRRARGDGVAVQRQQPVRDVWRYENDSWYADRTSPTWNTLANSKLGFIPCI